MKKLVFMFVAVAAISFASCGNKAQAPVQDTDSIAEVVLIQLQPIQLLSNLRTIERDEDRQTRV